MGKYLTNFKTKEEYEAFKAGGSYLTPNVSFIETAGSVINDSYQIQGGSASTMEYWDVTALPLGAAELAIYALLVKFKTNGAIYIRSTGSMFGEIEAEELETSLFAIALDKNIKMIDSKDGSVATVGEIFESKGFPDFTSIGWKQITEEEFYNLDNGGGVA